MVTINPTKFQQNLLIGMRGVVSTKCSYSVTCTNVLVLKQLTHSHMTPTVAKKLVQKSHNSWKIYQIRKLCGTYLMLGNRSDTIPLNNFKSSTKNLGTLTSLIALKQINSWKRSSFYHKLSKATKSVFLLRINSSVKLITHNWQLTIGKQNFYVFLSRVKQIK